MVGEFDHDAKVGVIPGCMTLSRRKYIDIWTLEAGRPDLSGSIVK